MAAVVAMDTQLMLGVGLIEKDTNGEVLWVWCYPSTTASLRNLLLRKCCLTDENKFLHPFVFGQYRRTWFYVTTVEVPDSSVLKKVTHFSIVLTAKDFNPEKYAAFTRILCRIYLKYGSPVKMMESYIAVLTKGICQSEENGSFLSRDFDGRKAYLAGSIKDIVSQFGMETVILHTALMLKKRIVVYHPKIEAVQEFTRTLPALVWHRQDWTILHSYMHLHAEELESLQMCTGYIAGFVELEVSNRPDLYDVFVNLADSEITIAPLAKEAMMMGKLHKEIGQLIVQSAEDPEKSDSQVIQEPEVRYWVQDCLGEESYDDAGQPLKVMLLRPASRPQHPAPEYLTFRNPELQVGFHLDSGATTPLAAPASTSSSSWNGPEGDAGLVGSATQGEEPTGVSRP